MHIRLAHKEKDFDQIWEIFSAVIATADTYVFDPKTPKDSLHSHWFADYMDTFVAVDEEDKVLGTYIVKPNQIDLGNHIANCSYMVNPKFQGNGIGSRLCEHSINIAKEKGYLGIQFNIVVSTNTNAVALWKKFGFTIIGITPKGFRHATLGLVDTYIMHKDLQKVEYNNMAKNTSNTNPLSASFALEKVGVRLKICGMKYPQNILELGSLLPDYMGFIFWEKSARYFDGQMPDLPQSIKKTGVFVNAHKEEIEAKVTKYDLQAVQLHGNESVAFCHDLKNTLAKNIEIIKVFSVDDAFDFDQLQAFETVCDYFLFDTKGKLPGGNGTTFDWKVLEKYPSQKPFFLSGGIGVEEIDLVNEILKTNLTIHAIDLNSKFEIEAGLKNKEELLRFKQKINF